MLGLSDPYAVVRIGPSNVPYNEKTLTFTTETKYKTLNPKWNKRFEVASDKLAANNTDLEFDIRIFDRDQFGSDDLLGCVHIPITSRNCTEEEYPLTECSTAATIRVGWQTTYENHSMSNSPEAHKIFEVLTQDSHSMLTLAVEHGHGAIASMLIRAGIVAHDEIDHKVRGDRGVTALHYACLNGDKEATKLLLAFGAEPRSFSNDGTPAILYATFNNKQNNLDTFETIVKWISPFSRHNILSVPDQFGWTALHTLCSTGSMGHLKWIGRGSMLPKTLGKVRINAVTLNGLSVMHLAAWNLSLETLRLLLQVHHLSSTILKRKSSNIERYNISERGGSGPPKVAHKNLNPFPVFIKRQLKTKSSKECTALDLAILRYLDESEKACQNSLYSRALDCILVLSAANFTAASTVGSPCQRVFDRVLLAGDTGALAGF